MVFMLGLRCTFRGWKRKLDLISLVVFQASRGLFALLS